MKKYVKRFALALFALVAAVSCCACGDKNSGGNDGDKESYKFDIGGSFSLARDFSEGRAFVKDGDGARFIDGDGKTVLTVTDENVGDFHEGKAWYISGTRGGYMTDDGNKICATDGFSTASVRNFCGGLAAVYIVQAYGVDSYVISSDGKRNELFEELRLDGEYGDFCDGIAFYKPSGGNVYGYIKSDGTKITDAVFSEAGDFSCERAKVKTSDDTYFISPSAQKVFSVKDYLQVGEFSDDVVKVKSAQGWSYLDKNGDKLFDGYFDEAGDFSCGFAVVKKDGRMYAIDKTGTKKFDAPESATEMRGASENFFAYLSGGKWGFVGADGTVKVQPKFEYAGDCTDGFSACRFGGKWGYVKLGKGE